MNDPTLELLVSLAADILSRMEQRGLTLATAESITGGLIGHVLTETAGSSRVYLGGVITYDNRLKERIGVPSRVLVEHGAVSEQTALAMANGIREWTGADVGVATTGIAGPSGATETKPVGLTFIAVADEAGVVAERHDWSGDRAANKLRTTEAALQLLLKQLDEGML